MAIRHGARPGGSTLDLKNAGAALFEPDLDHLSLEAILVLASGKFSAEIVEQVLAASATRQRHMAKPM